MKRFELSLYAGSVGHAPGDTVLILIPEDERPLCGDAGRIDWRLRGAISQKLATGYVTGAPGEATLLQGCAPLSATRLMLLGVGPVAKLRARGAPGLEAVMGEAIRRLCAIRAESVLLALPAVVDLDAHADVLMRAVLGALPQDGSSLRFRLIVPEAAAWERRLKGALAELAQHAQQRGFELAMGWVSSAVESSRPARPAKEG